MEVTVSVEGLDRIERTSQKVHQQVAQELAVAMFVSVKHVEREAKQSILSGQKSGREYKRRGVVHKASAPGEAPASDTGGLVNSVNGSVDKQSLASGRLEGKIAVSKKHGLHLEIGTRHIAPRPFLFPAFERSKRFIRDRLNKAVRKGLS